MAQPNKSTSPSGQLYRSDIITGAHGDRYQKDLALIIFERATRKKYQFRLGCEMSIAAKFDDVAFFDEIKNHWTLIQTKHTVKPKVMSSPLKFEMLFPSDEKSRERGDFSLFKYLKSYVTVQTLFKEQKNIIIFTNRDLSENCPNRSIEVELRQVNDILCFNHGVHVGFKVNDHMIKEMVDYVNRDYYSLKESISKLFEKGTVDQTLINFKTPVASILTKTNNYVKFSDNYSSEASQMLDSLKDVLDIKTAKVPLNKCKDLFVGNSRNKKWPIYASEAMGRQFFEDLILSVRQPNDLRDFIDQDLNSWMRTWIRPEYYTRLEESQLKIWTVNLEKFFNEKQAQVKNCNDGTSYKYFVELNDGKKFFDDVKKDLKKQIRNLANYSVNNTSLCYISRQIEFTEYCNNDRDGDSDRGRSAKIRIHDEEFVDELSERFKSQRLLLLIAEPGMGKSTILEFIALTAQQKTNDHVYLFHLNTLNQKLLQMENDAADKLLSVFRTVLSDKKFKNLCKTVKGTDSKCKHFMIFDAYDEVLPQNRMKVLKIFNHLLIAPNLQILVSVRRSLKDLEGKEFDAKTLSLVPFDNRDQINFLRQFWKVSEEHENKFQKYVSHLFNFFHSDVNRTLCEFTGLPLMLKMLAEIYDNNFQKYLTSEQNNLDEVMCEAKLDTIHLYEQFVKKCFNNKMLKQSYNVLQDLTDYNEIIYKKFVLEHQLLAIKHLQIKCLQNVFNNKEYNKTFQDFEKRILNSNERSPLVEAADDDSTFIHISYAEFLVANFLFWNFKNYEAAVFDSKSKANLFDGYPMVRKFFFSMVELQTNTKHLNILKKHYIENSDIVLWACEVHGLRTVKALLSIKWDVSIITELLSVAAEYNCNDICAYLFEHHQGIVDYKFNDWTPLQIAAKQGHINLVEMLISHSGDVNAKRNGGWTPLHLASHNGHANVAKVLIEHSADVNAKDFDGWTPLHIASQNGHSEVVKILTESFGDTNVKQNDDWTPLHLASHNGHEVVAEILIDNLANVNAENNKHWIPLHFAAKSGHKDVVRLLINRSGNVNAKDVNGWTPLHLSAQHGHSEVVKILLENAGDINARQKEFRTPLQIASLNNHSQVVKVINEYFENVNAKYKGWTLLHYAAQNGHSEDVKILVDNHVNINAKNSKGWTPLHYAVQNGHTEIVEILINNSGYVNAKTNNGSMPLHLAAESGDSDISKILINSFGDVNAKTNKGWTPLHFAAQEGHSDIVKLLLENRANVDEKDNNGLNPFHYASQDSHQDVMELLRDISLDNNE